MTLDARQIELMGELARALRRQDWKEARGVLRRAGLSQVQADVFLLEEYDRAKAEERAPVKDRP